ncbi:neprilysin-1-like isoform X2 [Oratosquilla oratoria]|uniref:neprilysin-1-like isoform X2 n=1 Tax=Oratosquilla oratoria TaxID=337810 RepID=UPI003F762739
MEALREQVELQQTGDAFYSVSLEENNNTVPHGTATASAASRNNVARGRAIVALIACVGLAAATVASIAIFASSGKSGKDESSQAAGLPDRFVHDVLEDKGLPEAAAPQMTDEEMLQKQVEDNPNPRPVYKSLVAFRRMVQDIETALQTQEEGEEDAKNEGEKQRTMKKKVEGGMEEEGDWVIKDVPKDKDEDSETSAKLETKEDDNKSTEEENKENNEYEEINYEDKDLKGKDDAKEKEEIEKMNANEKGERKIEMKAEEEGEKDKETINVVEEKKGGGAWRKLPQRKDEKGNFICETPACAMAAVAIGDSLDVSADPCQDFYQFACGGWIKKHPIPEDELSVSSFGDAQELLDKRLLLILNSEADPEMPAPLHMSRDFFKSCVDTDAMDKLGLQPLVDELAAQGGWPIAQLNWDEEDFSLEEALVHVRDVNVIPLIGVGIEADMLNTSRKLIYVSNGRNLLNYKILSSPEDYPEVMKAYKTYMVEAAKLMRDDQGATEGVTDEDINAQVDDVIAFEVKVAKAAVSQVPYYNQTAAYIATTIEELQTFTDATSPGQLNWLTYFKLLFTNTGVKVTAQEPLGLDSYPTYFAALGDILAKTPKKTVANYLGWTWVSDMASETTYAMRNLTDDFYKALVGVSLFDDRTSFCVQQTNIDMGLAVSRDYIDMFFPETARPEVKEVIEDIRYAFRMLISKTNWMDVYNKVYAKEKLQAIEPFAAYPDWIMDDVELTNGYEGLVINRKDHFGNLVRLGSFISFISLSSYKTAPESTFVLPPTVVNAFYIPLYNSITILAGILQPPFYAHNSLAAMTYGGIGVIIGHEMTHGFDNTGRQFDKHGNLVQWWSDETVEAYEKRSKCFVDQYSAFHPPELVEAGMNVSVNGQLTLGENIADNGGLREAYLAYRLWVERYGEEPRLPGLEEFSPDHIFYLAYANQWCEHNTANAVLSQVSTNPHSPGRFRVLGPLSNDAEFSETWKCPKDSPMNREEERCLLW